MHTLSIEIIKGDKIEVESPLFDIKEDEEDEKYYHQKFENISHKLPERYKKIISQNEMSKQIKLSQKLEDISQKLRRIKNIPKHIFWWKAIEDRFKKYFIKKFGNNKLIKKYIECNGISELRKHGILHNCISGPPLYDSLNFEEKWFIEFFAICINVKPRENKNLFPYYYIEDKSKLIFEMKVVTYSNKKNLGLHMPSYD